MKHLQQPYPAWGGWGGMTCITCTPHCYDLWLAGRSPGAADWKASVSSAGWGRSNESRRVSCSRSSLTPHHHAVMQITSLVSWNDGGWPSMPNADDDIIFCFCPSGGGILLCCSLVTFLPREKVICYFLGVFPALMWGQRSGVSYVYRL